MKWIEIDHRDESTLPPEGERVLVYFPHEIITADFAYLNPARTRWDNDNWSLLREVGEASHWCRVTPPLGRRETRT